MPELHGKSTYLSYKSLQMKTVSSFFSILRSVAINAVRHVYMLSEKRERKVDKYHAYTQFIHFLVIE